MRDNLRQYRAIRAALTPGYPGEPTGRVAQHMATLAALMSGIVARKRTQWPKVAAHVPAGCPAGEPRQTLCQVAEERPGHRGSVCYPLCGGLVGAFGVADARAGHGWECGGTWG